MEYPMETRVVSLVKHHDREGYLYGVDKNYIIPEYQREYSWGESQVESLLASVRRALEGENVFMGTVQFACESDNPNQLHVIDGQQRMTSFLLLCYVLEKKSGKDILRRHGMKLEIRNFASNQDKLLAALQLEDAEIDGASSENNRYIENMQLLRNGVEELLENVSVDFILSAIMEKMYFVELVTEDIPLPQVVGIFNTINTTGLDLNCADLFKLQCYEYLKKNYPEHENWMHDICMLYEEVNQKECNMQDILDIYKHAIVARYSLGWEMLSKSNEAFFEEVFGKREPEPKAEILQFEELKKITDIYLELCERVYEVQSIYAFATDVIWMTRYGRYWTLPYVIAYFNGKEYEKALEEAMEVGKYLVVRSVNHNKVINQAQTFLCREILPAISRGESIKELIQTRIGETPPEWKNQPANWNQREFKERIKKNLFDNGKRSYIVCTLSALLEEINAGKSVEEIEKKLFDWKNFQYDMEHILARDIFEENDPENIAEYNGIGNLVVLHRSINRGIGSAEVQQKVKEYEESKKYDKEPQFVSVGYVAKQIREAGDVWGIQQVRTRCKEQEKLLCDFLGL